MAAVDQPASLAGRTSRLQSLNADLRTNANQCQALSELAHRGGVIPAGAWNAAEPSHGGQASVGEPVGQSSAPSQQSCLHFQHKWTNFLAMSFKELLF